MSLHARPFLSRTGWLSRTDPAFAAAVLDKAVRLTASKGETVWQAGDEGGGLIGIVEGDVSCYTAAGASGAPLLHIAGPGAWTGEATIITGEPKRITLVARGPLRAVVVSRADVMRLLAEQPEWWREIGRLAIDLEQTITTAVADLLLPTSQVRCIGVLLRISGLRFHDQGGRRAVQLSHEELGQMAGIGRQAAARSVAALEAQGLIASRYGVIELRHPGRLREMLEEA